jgi:hypothetical protein
MIEVVEPSVDSRMSAQTPSFAWGGLSRRSDSRPSQVKRMKVKLGISRDEGFATIEQGRELLIFQL